MVNLNKNVVAHWAAEAAVIGSNQAPMEMVVQYIREAEGVISPPPPAGKFKNEINKIN